MADVALSFAVEKLGNLLIEKAVFLQGVEEQVARLKDELKRMQCFLKDAAKKQAKDERIRQWISDIRDVALDAEDAIEIFILKVDSPRRSRGLLGRCASFPIRAYHLNAIGEKIASIQARLDDITKSRETYGIENLGGDGQTEDSSTTDVEWRRRLSPWQKDKHLVGLEEDVEKLLRKAILKETRGVSIATIVGMGGIGKSTLARKLYNDNRAADQFDCRAWVVVSSEFSPRKIIKELIVQLLAPNEDKLKVLETMEKLEMQSLREMLHQRLQGKRYFIVVDDVWEDAHFDDIKDAFPDEDDKASRLVLTSRNRIATKYSPYVHEMKLLDPKQSRELLLKTALIENKFPEELETIGSEILKKCNGLPLAISVVGGLLADKIPSRRRWEKVLKEINSHLQESGSAVSTILELSYRNLSPQLKSCFLCLGFFKEDSTIRVKKLVQVWIARGLIPQESGGGSSTMEETGRGYLDDLINRNMVQIKDMRKDEEFVKSCHMHDLVHELCLRKAKEEIRFHTLITKENKPPPPENKPPPRHCVVDRSSIYLVSRNKYLHSLFFHEPIIDDHHVSAFLFERPYHDHTSVNPSYLKSFVLLKVLDFEDFFLGEVSSTIGTMGSLRYLGLRHTGIRKLPRSFGRLKTLEVLDIARNSGLRVPISIIWQMTSLRHLYAFIYLSISKERRLLQMGTLKNLQTLNEIYIRDETVMSWLTQMTSLRKLGLNLMGSPNSSFGNLCTSLAMLKNLDSLTLHCSDSSDLQNMDGLGILHSVTRLKLSVPAINIGFPPNLTSLTISTILDAHCYDVDPMPVLEKLPKLLYLELVGLNGVREMVISHDGFPTLKILSLRWMRSLQNIQVIDGGMPELKRFHIDGCPKLEIDNIPQQLRSITTIIF